MIKSILVIDDDNTIRKLVTDFLIEAGYDVIAAQDGEEGIEFLKNDPDFNVIITDICMPKKDGNAVARYVRDSVEKKNIPVIAITGYANEVESELFTYLLEKPFKIKELVEMIDSLH